MKKSEEKLSLKVRLRRWWKDYKEMVRYKGWIMPLIEDFVPFYDRLNNLYWWIRHRTVDVYHKIDTRLAPGYYDIDHLMLHGMFSLLCRYVEEEMGGIAKCEKNIADIESNWGEGTEDIPEEHRADFIEANKRQADGVREALVLYRWWKEVYPFYDDNDPWMKRENDSTVKELMDRFEFCQTDKDGDPTLYEWKDDRTPEQKKKLDDLSKLSQEYEERTSKETEDNLIRLVKLRKSLWM